MFDCIHCEGRGRTAGNQICRICQGTGQVDETAGGWLPNQSDEHHDDSESWPRNEDEAEPYLDILKLL